MLASIFVTVPFVIREVEPVLHETRHRSGGGRSHAGLAVVADVLAVTLPSIRWGLTYGVVLTVARTLGEFGAVIMVSSNLPGHHKPSHCWWLTGTTGAPSTARTPCPPC